MTLSELRPIHSALVTMQRPNYKLSGAMLMLAAKQAALLEPQILALDASNDAVRNASDLAAHAAHARFTAEIEQIKADSQAKREQLSAAECEVKDFTLPEADVTAALAATPELLEVIKPLLPFIK